MEFRELKEKDTFTITTEFGDAEFLKIDSLQAKCLDSRESTYEKARDYCISYIQKVNKTC